MYDVVGGVKTQNPKTQRRHPARPTKAPDVVGAAGADGPTFYDVVGAEYSIIGQQQMSRPLYSIVGAEPGMLAQVEAWMEKETAGVKNKWLALGGVALAAGALGFYGRKKNWF